MIDAVSIFGLVPFAGMNTISRFVGVSLADFKKFGMAKKKNSKASNAPDGQKASTASKAPKASETPETPEAQKIDTDAEKTVYKWSTKGLKNHRIDCYLLAILQFLFHIPAFRALLLAHTGCKSPKCKACVLRQILVHYFRAKGPVVGIAKKLLYQLRIDQRQNDAHEQFTKLVNFPEVLKMATPLITFRFVQKVSSSFIHSYFLFI